MTAQIPESFVNEHPSLAFGEWHVYGVIRGTPSEENGGWGDRRPVHRAVPREVPAMTTANWKGFVERWRLTREGALVLDAIVYSDSSIPPLVTNERIEGDFFLVLKSAFEGPRQYVPFSASRVVVDPSSWMHEAYVGASPSATELRRGRHPDFPRRARLWYEVDLAPDTERD